MRVPPRFQPSARHSAIFYGFASLLALYVLLMGPAPQRPFCTDLFTMLEAGHRMVQGLIPFSDYHTIMGPLAFLSMGCALSLCHGNAALAIPISMVIPYVPIAILCWSVCSRRFAFPIAFLLASYLSLLWMSYVPLHYLFYLTTYSVYYNRQLYVVISIIFILLYQPSAKSDLFVGLLLGLLGFWKVTYFVAGGFLVGAFAIRRLFRTASNYQSAPRLVLLTTLGFLAGILPFVIYLGMGGLVSMFRDYHDLSEVGVGRIYRLGLAAVIPEILIIFIILQELIGDVTKYCSQEQLTDIGLTNGRIWVPFNIFLKPFIYELLVIFTAGFLTEMGGCPCLMIPEVPLLIVYAIAVGSRLVDWRSLAAMPWLIRLKLAAGIFILVGLPYGNLCLGLLYPLIHPAVPGQDVFEIKSSYVHLFIGDKYYAHALNDGIALLSRHPELQNAMVADLDVYDSFPTCLNRPSARNVPLTFDLTNELNDKIHPRPEVLFQYSRAVLVPSGAYVVLLEPTIRLDVLKAIPEYEEYIKTHFDEVDQSEQWILWERKPGL